MSTGVRVDPFGNANFLIEIDGITRGSFSEVTGLDSTIDMTEYREGGDNMSPRKLPGLTKHANIVLRWGLVEDDELYLWHREWVTGVGTRRNGSIIVLDRQGVERLRWNFIDAWPIKWDPPDFNATANQVAIDSLELAHEGLVRA